MNDPPLVSIVTPSLNQHQFIQATIDSVLAQDYPNIEYAVVDGGSTDGTLEVLAAAGPRVRWVSEPDGGQADAINRALERANGEYLAWLNSDDVYLPGAISAMAVYLTEHPDHALVYGHVDNIDPNGRPLGPAEQVEPFDAGRLLNDVDFVAQPATLFRRSAFEKVGGLDSSLSWTFDYDLWLKLAWSHRVGFIDGVLAQARIHSAAKTTTGGLPRLLEIETVARRHGRRYVPMGFEAEMVRARTQATIDAIRARRMPDAVHHARSGLRHLAAYAIHRFARRRFGDYVRSDATRLRRL